jgi:hypothetical protein
MFIRLVVQGHKKILEVLYSRMKGLLSNEEVWVFAEIPGPIRMERFRGDMFVRPRARICKPF